MSLSKTDVKTIASLAQLHFDDELLGDYTKELSKIMEMIRELQKVNTDAVEPMSHPQDIELRLRKDEVTEVEQREELLNIAPQTSDGFYLVPKVLH